MKKLLSVLLALCMAVLPVLSLAEENVKVQADLSVELSDSLLDLLDQMAGVKTPVKDTLDAAVLRFAINGGEAECAAYLGLLCGENVIVDGTMAIDMVSNSILAGTNLLASAFSISGEAVQELMSQLPIAEAQEIAAPMINISEEDIMALVEGITPEMKSEEGDFTFELGDPAVAANSIILSGADLNKLLNNVVDLVFKTVGQGDAIEVQGVSVQKADVAQELTSFTDSIGQFVVTLYSGAQGDLVRIEAFAVANEETDGAVGVTYCVETKEAGIAHHVFLSTVTDEGEEALITFDYMETENRAEAQLWMGVEDISFGLNLVLTQDGNKGIADLTLFVDEWSATLHGVLAADDDAMTIVLPDAANAKDLLSLTEDDTSSISTEALVNLLGKLQYLPASVTELLVGGN